MLFPDEVQRIGYLSRSVPKGVDLKAALLELKQKKKAIFLAHYYVQDALQEVADVVGDSLALAQASKQAKADVILFCGVHFMAETAKILNPNSKVLLPDLHAGCSLADATPTDAFRQLKKQHPDAVVISYINCSAEIKALSDIICTSSNAVDIVQHIPTDKSIIFAPDRNLGKYVEQMTGRKMILWDGACVVHEQISLEKITMLMDQYPEAEVIAHPECVAPLLEYAQFIGSTKALIDYASKSSSDTFIVATEAGILWKMRQVVPEKKLIAAPAIENNSCACSECPYMKMNTLEKAYNALYYEQPEIQLDTSVRLDAARALNAMLTISAAKSHF